MEGKGLLELNVTNATPSTTIVIFNDHVDSGRDPWKIQNLGLRWEKNLQEWGGDKGGKGEKTGVRKLKVKKGKEKKGKKKKETEN